MDRGSTPLISISYFCTFLIGVKSIGVTGFSWKQKSNKIKKCHALHYTLHYTFKNIIIALKAWLWIKLLYGSFFYFSLSFKAYHFILLAHSSLSPFYKLSDTFIPLLFKALKSHSIWWIWVLLFKTDLNLLFHKPALPYINLTFNLIHLPYLLELSPFLRPPKPPITIIWLI